MIGRLHGGPYWVHGNIHSSPASLLCITLMSLSLSLSLSLLFHFELFTARSELRKVLFLAMSVTFCLRMKYLGNC